MQGGAIVAVLAGGAGSRLGGAKACVPLGGRPLIEHPLGAARTAGLEAIVVAKPSSELPPLAEHVVLEPELPRHPLTGILAALRHADAAASGGVVAVGCDMPFLAPELLAWLADLDGDALARVKGRVQPLPARLALAALAPLERALPREPPLRDALLALGPRVLAEDELARFGDPRRLTASVNDSDGLRAAQGLLGS